MRHSALIVVCLTSCIAPGGDDATRGVEQEVDTYNGTSLNGTSLNGTSLNGTSLTGTSISASSASGPPLSGSGVVGSTWTGTASNGATVNLRIDSALQGTSPNTDLWFYGVSYQTSSGWSPLCGLDSTLAPIKAVPVAGVWDKTATYATSATQFTWACRGKTIGKCVELGYKTYKGYADHMATCVRLLRGDYCGNGSAYTVDGTLLNLYDNVGVQADAENWHPEGEWTPAGARCININFSYRYDLTAGKDPSCAKKAKSTACGTTFRNGALLIDELP